MADSASAAASQPQYTNVILHHIPNQYAPMLLSTLMMYAFCLGIISLETFGNVHYDYRQVIRRKGWREPVKACNRIAYLASRYSACVFLFSAILNLTLPKQDCDAFAKSVLFVWALPLFMVDLIFVQRTLALYNWNMRLVLPLGVLYVTYVGFCVYGVVEFGSGQRIPGSDFCGFVTTNVNEEPHKTMYILYSILTITLDTVVLLLTAHRLVDGGLTNVFTLLVTDTSALRRDRAERTAAGQEVGEISLQDLILRQGVGYYMVLQASRVAFLVVYYTHPTNSSLQILVAGIMATVGPLLAGLLFRQTAEAINRTANATSRNSQLISNVPSRLGDDSPTSPAASSGRTLEKFDVEKANDDDEAMRQIRRAQGRQISIDAMSVSMAAASYQHAPHVGRARPISTETASPLSAVAHLPHGDGPRTMNLLGVDEDEDQVLPPDEAYSFGATPPS